MYWILKHDEFTLIVFAWSAGEADLYRTPYEHTDKHPYKTYEEAAEAAAKL